MYIRPRELPSPQVSPKLSPSKAGRRWPESRIDSLDSWRGPRKTLGKIWIYMNLHEFISFTYAFCTVIYIIYINSYDSYAFMNFYGFTEISQFATGFFGSQMTKNLRKQNKSNHGWLPVSALSTFGLLKHFFQTVWCDQHGCFQK